jgi:hypothetical protein
LGEKLQYPRQLALPVEMGGETLKHNVRADGSACAKELRFTDR